MLVSTQLTLLLQPFIDLALPSPPISPCSGSTSRSSENRRLCRLPPSAFPARPHTYSVFHCAVFVGGPFSPLSVYTYWPLCPRAGDQCARTQKEDGRWDLPFLPTPPGGSRALCLPTVLSGCTWSLWVSPPPSIFCPRKPAPAVSSSRDVSPESLRAPVSPHLRQQPPFFSFRAHIMAW